MSSGAGILCIGSSHKTASLAARERFALVGSAAADLASELLEHPDVLEVVALTTCNRSELYLYAADVDAALPVVVATFARLAQADPEELATMLAVRQADAAVDYLFRVAAGVESVVIGEAQIQGQLKDALATAQDSGSCGPVLDRLFRHALEVGKRARTETGIGDGKASVGSVAATLVEERLGDLSDAAVLLVGAGTMSELAARNLSHRGARQVFVANRNAVRAASLAEQFSGTAVSFESLERELVRCDVVVSSTSAPHPVLTVERVADAITQRRGRRLVLVDLAVPRDIEPAVGDLPGCSLYDLDDLERVVSQTLASRGGEIEAIHTIVAEEVCAFGRWHRAQGVVPAITELRDRAEDIRQRELVRFHAKLAHLAPEDRRRVEQLTRSIINKLLHEPTSRLRAVAADEQPGVDHEVYASTVRHLFGLQSVAE